MDLLTVITGAKISDVHGCKSEGGVALHPPGVFLGGLVINFLRQEGVAYNMGIKLKDLSCCLQKTG